MGNYGKTSLDGLALAEYIQSPEHQSMFESFGNWNFDYVYIDEKATDGQEDGADESEVTCDSAAGGIYRRGVETPGLRAFVNQRFRSSPLT